MYFMIAQGLLIPFIGTSVGAACVLFLSRSRSRPSDGCVNGFAAGVMTAASVWSLLIPSADLCADRGKLAFLPAAGGLLLGVLLFSFAAESGVFGNENESGSLLTASVVIHNVPEGMAVGAVWAALLSGAPGVDARSAFLLSLGIAVQNVPEGAIVSLSEEAKKKTGSGKNRDRSSAWAAVLRGVLSGAPEPIAGLLTILLSRFALQILPWLMSFAAGTMLFAVTDELIPSMHSENGKKMPVISFGIGFALMMSMDMTGFD